MKMPFHRVTIDGKSSNGSVPNIILFYAEALGQARWTEADLKRRPKGDPAKARMAAQLRAETAMTWLWIAERLGMGHWRTAANAVRRLRTGK